MWEAEKRRKLKEERDKVQKMKQLADDAERKAQEVRPCGPLWLHVLMCMCRLSSSFE